MRERAALATSSRSGPARRRDTPGTQPVHRQRMRGNPEALRLERREVDAAASLARHVLDALAALAHEVIVRPRLRIEARAAAAAVLDRSPRHAPLADQALEVAIHGAETDARQLAAHGCVDPVGRRVRTRGEGGA